MNNVLEYLENSAKRLPYKTAISDIKTNATYNDVINTSKKIGRLLGSIIDPQRPIPVMMEKSVETVELFFGIVYASGCYSLLDPQHPVVRKNSILDILNPEFLITDNEHIEMTKDLEYVKNGGRILLCNELCTGSMSVYVLNMQTITFVKLKTFNVKDCLDNGDIIPPVISSSTPLYINFTSGSTGTPKGVVVGHGSVISFINDFVQVCGITENDIIGNQAPFDFDVSVKDIYSTICCGATMQIVPRDVFPFPMRILDFVCDRKVTTMIWAVSSLCIVSGLRGFDYRIPSDVNKVIFSGEIMPVKHLNIWKSAIPHAQFINVYGPTEITCNCTYYKIQKDFEIGQQIPIGINFNSDDVFLLDENNNVIPKKSIGVSGELCVGGPNLALGYYNNAVQTENAFVPDPRHVGTIVEKKNKYDMSGYIYRTGDLAYYLEDGNLMFGGRKDFQIKHMGHRIELNEIELALEKIENIVRCCVIYDQEKDHIIAFYQGNTEKKEIVEQLKNHIPIYMLPNKIRQVESFKLNEHGKIDRKALHSIINHKRTK